MAAREQLGSRRSRSYARWILRTRCAAWRLGELAAALAFGPMMLTFAAAAAEEPVDFHQQVRPLLSSRCFQCHGVDPESRQADLRLDVADQGLLSRPDGERPVVVPGAAQQSLLWERIVSQEPDEVMPPPEHPPLEPDEIELLRRWIDQGADFAGHWAFEPVRTVPLPPEDPDLPDWNAHPIDRFLLSAMRRQGLEPQPEADRSTLLRRACWTLTGLPPTPQQAEAFMADDQPGAYERLVDSLLASPHYGEEMARHWLDLARYGDTHGLHLDNERQMWLYRDWVVEAFNRNLPFDRFTIEQLAGDLLPEPSLDQLVATGFNRCNVTTSEGGAIDQEFLFRYAVDRTSTTMQAWLGLTGGCAVCHAHKYDPILHEDFYRLYAFFYSAADPAMDGNIDTTGPFLKVPSPEQRQQQSALAIVRQQTEAELERLTERLLAGQGGWLTGQRHPAESLLVRDVWLDDLLPEQSSTSNTSRNAPRWTEPGEFVPASGQRSLQLAFGDRYTLTVRQGSPPRVVPQQPRLEVAWRVDPRNRPEAMWLQLKTDKGWRHIGWSAADQTRRLPGGAVRVADVPEDDRWHRFVIDTESLGLEPGDVVSELVFGQFGGICWVDELVMHGSRPAAGDPLESYAAWEAQLTDNQLPQAVRDALAPAAEGEDPQLAEQRKRRLQRHYLGAVARRGPAELLAARQARTQAMVAAEVLEDRIPGTFVFGELSTPRQARVMHRGEYDRPGEPVEPGTPPFLPPLKLEGDSSQRPSRLDLARWLVSEDQPLTPRVSVNRLWQQVFGLGLVETPDDFGAQGTPPSHPDLLDWLADDFRRNGWDMRRLMRLLVTSQAFRQSAAAGSEAYSRDPANRWLARGPRLRLDAEQLRDGALLVAGLLCDQPGGPGFRPYQPPDIWEPVGYGDSNTRYYLQEHGPQVYRRSLYMFLKRTAPPPLMSNFDAPNREQACSRRMRSNTPLQALQLLNDVHFVEAARQLASRVLTDGTVPDKGPRSRLEKMLELVLTRPAGDHELSWLEETLGYFRQRYAQAESAEAERLIGFGDSIPPENLEPTELAAWTAVANLLLNLDEVVNRP